MKKQTSVSVASKSIVQKTTQGFNYTAPEITENAALVSDTMQEDLNKARIREIESKFITRMVLTTLFMFLLFAQNVTVFYVVYQAFILHQLSQLQLIFATLIAATLTETYFVIKIIVNYMFKDEDYTYKKS